jgi:hypothetical protein
LLSRAFRQILNISKYQNAFQIKGKLHKEEFNNLFSSPNIIRMIKSSRMRWSGHVARMGEKRNACRILVGNPEGKRPLGRPKRRWVDNNDMDLRELGWGSMD